MERKAYFGCNLCEGLCGLEVTLEGSRIRGIRGDPEDVFTRGHICPKGVALKDLHEDPDRLRQPLERVGGAFQPVPWTRAFAEAGARLRDIRRRHGRDAVALYVGTPAVHSHRLSMGVAALAGALRTRNLFSANSQDSNPRLFACLQMYGDSYAVPVPDIDRTDFLLMLGANPLATHGSLWALGDVRRRFADARARGARLVLVDPRRNETAAACDEHHFIRPGTDAAFLLSLLHVVFSEGLVRRAELEDVARGASELEQLAASFTPEAVASVVGIGADVIRRLARTLAGTPRAAVYGRLGLCQSAFGPVASWLVDALNVVTGHFDREGGVMFPEPAANAFSLLRRLVPPGFGRWRSRVRGLPELLGALPAAAMAEEMETPGPGQIRALVCLAGDPVLSTPNGPRLARALERLECVVSVDFYLNETARRAHFVLPPAHVFQSGNFELMLAPFAVRNFARYSPPILPLEPDERDDWDIASGLAASIASARAGPLAARAVRNLPERALSALLAVGPARTTLSALARKPHGVDLGPLRPSNGRRVRTRDGKVDLAPPTLVADVPRVRALLSTAARPGLVLVGRRHLRSNNSWMHNLLTLTKGPSRNELLMHPADARERGIEHGGSARVRTRAGEVEVRVALTEDLALGVVSLPHGFGHSGTLRLASALKGVSANVLTDEERLEPVTGQSILSGYEVEVERLRGP